jgi:diacylglycerol kinase family enzyme
MTSIAVIAHARKTLDGGLPELRRRLETDIGAEVLWYEVEKSRMAPKAAKRCLAAGADLILVWGGDGSVQRVVDTVAGSGVTLGIIPAGTANLLASNLGVPTTIDGAVANGLSGRPRQIDVVNLNGERFAVMAGTGFDANMIRSADGGLKDKLGRAAYVWTGTKSFRTPPFKAKIEVDGSPWFSGRASCILAGNVGALFGGVRVFDDA